MLLPCTRLWRKAFRSTRKRYLTMAGNFRLKAGGFTLIELLVVIALIGVLAAIGVPAYNGYVDGARKTAAQNGLRSIYLMEKDWYSTNGVYYLACCGDMTGNINTTLFVGEQTLSNQYYFYDIRAGNTGTSTSFTASAVKRSDGTTFSINQLNQTTGF